MGLPFPPPSASCPFHNGERTELWMLAGEQRQQHPAGRKLDNAFVTPRIVCHRREFTLRGLIYCLRLCSHEPRTAPQRACTEIFVGRCPGASLFPLSSYGTPRKRETLGARRTDGGVLVFHIRHFEYYLTIMLFHHLILLY